MIHKPFQRVARSAFTLIELLIVMAIIAILISLLLSAVVRVLRKVDEVRNRNDITQLAQAEVNFQTKFDVEYLPSRFVLCETLNDYQTGMSDPVLGPLYSDSLSYLTRLWPRLNFNTPQTGPNGSWTGIDWNHNGIQDGPVVLEGDQCLVFFLGGIQVTQAGPPVVHGCEGFSTDGTNPAQLGGSRIGPFYEFKSARLVDPFAFASVNSQYAGRPNTAGAGLPSGYFIYLDAYGKTGFAYFSSYKSQNTSYARYATIPLPGTGAINTDCSVIPNGPYNDGVNYYNPNSFQIISAGFDNKFGPGGTWVAGASIPLIERDDMSNFYDVVLGH
jgi:prepilin-type N-terminal cleavage/methylation domain-containing protein